MEVTLIKEHSDGSADVTLDCTPDEVTALFRYGFIHALMAGIQEAKEKYTPESNDEPKEV